MKKNLSSNAIAFLLVSLMFISSLTILSSNIGYAQPVEDLTFTSGEEINFTSDTEMTFKDHISMEFDSGVEMAFQSGIEMLVFELSDGWLEPCNLLRVVEPIGFMPEECSWWEAVDMYTGESLGEFHVDGNDGLDTFHVDATWPELGFPIPYEVFKAVRKIDIIESCDWFVVHWPEHWWPEPCTWWEIIDPETGEDTGYEFHVDETNESCEFHIDEMIPGPYILQFPWYEIWARRKIPDIKPCDWFVVHWPEHWWPEPCTWWEIINPWTGEPTGYEFHVDETNESCEFHIDEVIPEPYVFKFPAPYVIAEQKITEIKPCDWFIIVDPTDYLPYECSWWEVLDDTGAPTGLEFHVDVTDRIIMFHVDETSPDIIITIPPSYTVTVRKKIDLIQPCTWFKVDDPTLTPEPCSWWEILDDTGAPTGIEFHVDETIPADGLFHIDEVFPEWPIDIPPTYMLTAEKKIDDIQECDWFKVLDPPDFVPEPCSWWVIIWPQVWAGTHFHVDANDDVDMFHIDDVNGGGPPPPPPPPWNVTAVPYEPPSLPWYMKAPYPDYAPSGMPDFDQRQGGTYPWQDPAGRWSHCGPTAVANSLWWLDSEFEPNTIPPPVIIDNYPLVQAYGKWDDHDPLNVPPLVEHLAWLMDTDGRRTGIIHSGTDVFDMQAGITHYLSWSGVNPLGDVDGDGEVTPNDENIVMMAWGSTPGMPGWDLRADIFPETLGPYSADNRIDQFDLDLVTMNMGLIGEFYEHTIMAPMWDLIVEEVLRCQDVVLLIAPWYYDPAAGWYRHDESAHFVTVAGLNATTWEIVLSDPMLDNAEAGGYGDVPVPHVHMPPEPPYITHNDASLVSHDAYHVIIDECPGGPLTIWDYPREPQPHPIWKWQIEAAVITSPLGIHDINITDVTTHKTIVGKGKNCYINVTVLNEGTFPETFNVTVYANTTEVDTQKVLNLAPGTQTSVILTWNTTGFSHAYNITAYATVVPGETDLADNTFVDGVVKVSCIGDINGDYVTDGQDYQKVKILIPSVPGDPNWNANADLNDDGIIDGQDWTIVKAHIGTVDP